MCGISGIISLDGNKINNLEKRIKLMTDLLHHRGPDGEGFYISPKKNFCLSNNRLSIVSPKESIKLPFTKNENEFLSFNGEIYNYLSLRDDLKDKGINFTTHTDTEVLYEFLKYYQKNDLEKLNGMWSFAFYNQEKNELFLSRDLLGERHLFYLIDNNELIFSSEVAPILHVSQNLNEFDFESLVTSWKFYSCSPGKTLIKNIFKLKPGTSLQLINGEIKINQFQKLQPEKWIKYFKNSPSIDEINDEFEKIFQEELELRLPKDVKFLTALSGGIDSSILAYFISKFKNMAKTIIGISDSWQTRKIAGYSEVEISKSLSNKLNLSHSEIYLNTPDCLTNIEYSASNAFDGCIDPAVANFSGLSSYAKNNNYKVMLFSDGVDELLGGYHSDIEANRIDKIFRVKKLSKLFQHLIKTDLGKKLVIYFLRLKKNTEFEYSYDPLYFRVNHSACPNIFLKKIIENYDMDKEYEFGKIDPMYNEIILNMDNSQIRALNYASKTIPDMYNLRSDKSSMQHSVEFRQPYQAVRIVEFFIAMPAKYRFRNGRGKYVLRNYVKNNISKKISKRPKIGMGAYLWSNKKIRNFINFDEEINNTNFFEKFPFTKNVKEILLDKNTHPANLWTAYSFIKTFNNLQNINKLKRNFNS